MRWVTLLAAVAVLQQPQPTFRTSVHLIVQPVSVKDRNGKPILGLTAKDFVLTEDGRPQDIVFVEYEPLDGGGVTPLPAVAAPASRSNLSPVTREAGVMTPPDDSRYRGRRLLILYFDAYGMALNDQYRALASAARYIDTSLTPADVVAVMTFKGRGVQLVQDFTDDREALAGVMRQLTKDVDEEGSDLFVRWDSGGAFGEDDETFNLFTADRQLAALQSAVTGLGGLPEVKTLVYFGGGLRLSGTENLAQLRATINSAIRANVTLNPIDSRGLVASAPMGDATRPSPGGASMFSGAIAGTQTTRFQQSQDTLYALAKDTGGKALLDTNDLSRGIAQAAQAVTGYYLIGYYTSNTAPDGRYRRVKISVNSPTGAELSYRAGYYANKVFEKFNAADRERQLADALRLEDPLTEIPMAMEVNYFQLNSAEYFVPVSIRMPGAELTRARSAGAARVSIDMIGELKDEFGVTHRNVRDKLEIPVTSGSIQYETAFTILPGAYVLKVLARNGVTGKIGTFQTSFTVPNLAREQVRLPISSVVLGNQQIAASSALFSVKQKIGQDVANPLVAGGRRLLPSVTRTFATARPMFVFLQAYQRGATPMRPLVAFVTLYREGQIVREDQPLAVTAAADAGSGAVPIRMTVPLDGLPAGRYECQVTVLDPQGNRAAFWRAGIALSQSR